ncbi:tRNA (adenosine(37)-N6)-threonylcarbamoyltransferase complex dimerization subunit type 1 TsaB [Homoserinibacter sp. YIM 151385]|uniref:tRNA (adenosine(37)-N6)-threonylcarbamoyltransferase complex dimerization subunit type 1 TsaB n=1 Tax=Homoserinibacter sp. YIM 151385 TaxID=2985506 RepID=UPI0022F10DED|nr:tRNA (adenosine(37)-N6)-threonylcarbamoyltransferase complex dimerization subunit type 1 TsaB [Homoserinibacter sp. YIM 151385]WBU37714.1 tRNA (adenosine(37)-N6)-threonylcarbamoyltransferase complex dimerization subunit type 1 TsaB [Homoserinibacter sp. YIM 151385]
MLLAIDSSTGTSVAVVDREGVVLARAGDPGTRGHAELIGRAIEAALAEAGIRARDLDAVAVGMGPGPFTGLRVGIAAGRVLALAVGARVLPVVSHDAVALDASGPALVVTDARRREVAWSRYEGGRRTHGPELATPDALETVVPGYAELERIDAALVDAGALGRLALRLERGEAPGLALAQGEPLYLRPPDATPQLQPKRVTA